MKKNLVLIFFIFSFVHLFSQSVYLYSPITAERYPNSLGENILVNGCEKNISFTLYNPESNGTQTRAFKLYILDEDGNFLDVVYEAAITFAPGQTITFDRNYDEKLGSTVKTSPGKYQLKLLGDNTDNLDAITLNSPSFKCYDSDNCSNPQLIEIKEDTDNCGEQGDYLDVSNDNLSFTADGGSQNVDITSNVSWTTSVSDSWIQVTPTSGSGDETLTISVADNSTTSSRTGAITVSGGGITRNISVYQEGMPAYFNLVVSNHSIDPNPLEYGRPATITVDVANTGNTDFTGRVYLSWHKSTGEYITDLAYFDNLGVGQTKQLYFSTNHIISSPGDYKLVVKYTEDFSTYPVIQNYPVSVICPNIEASGLKIIGYLFDKSVIYEIPYNYFTHINVSFANPNSDYQVIIDGMTEEDLRNFVTYAKSQNSNIQIFLAIGGAAASTEGSNTYNYYSQIFSDQQIRQTFIQNLIDLINYCNLDGIDIDIEYKALELDGVNDFMIELINSIHDLNKKVSIAAEYSTWGDKINDDVICVADWINAMAYNAYNENTSYQFFIDNYNYWIQVRNLDKNKLVMGIPLFGRYFIQNDVKEVDFCSIISSLEDSFDGNTQYEVHNYPSTGTTTYWNGPQAILDKTAFARDNAGGVMFWEISQALCDDNQDIFQRVYNTMFLTTNIKNDRSSDLVIYPNPSRGEINIASDLEIDKIEIYNLLGEKIKSISKPSGNKVYIPTSGIYLVKFYIGNKLILKKIIVN